MTMLSKVPDNARGDGFSCDVDSQLPLTDLNVAGCLSSEDAQIFTHLMAGNFCTTDEKQRKVWMHSPSYL